MCMDCIVTWHSKHILVTDRTKLTVNMVRSHEIGTRGKFDMPIYSWWEQILLNWQMSYNYTPNFALCNHWIGDNRPVCRDINIIRIKNVIHYVAISLNPNEYHFVICQKLKYFSCNYNMMTQIANTQNKLSKIHTNPNQLVFL